VHRAPSAVNQPGIYAIIHVLSGKRYVGQTTSFDRRWAQHKEALDGGFHHNARLMTLWKADGPYAFEFKALEQAPAYLNGKQLQEWLAKREAYYISTHKATASALNIIDAEFVETRASRAPAPKSHNSQVFAEIGVLKPEIAAAEARAAEARAQVNLQTNRVEQLKGSARPGLMGWFGVQSHAEKQRIVAANAALAQGQRSLDDLLAQLAETEKDEAALKQRRRHLYNAYEKRGRQRSR
jgi:group I intron endonuclease